VIRRLVLACALVAAAAACAADDTGSAAAPDEAVEAVPGLVPDWLASVTTAPTVPAGLGEDVGPEVGGRAPLAGFGEVAAVITGADGEPCEVCLLAALTTDQRARGLMEVTDPALGGYDGMVFAFETDVTSGFWMRNTPMPLSIAYFDADGVLVSQADMAPCPPETATCPSYPADGPFRYAVEVPQGRLADIGVVGPDGEPAGPRDAALVLTGTPCPPRDDPV
jgi:uncharacterized membrane protein (UPF0127 family)